MTFVATSLSVNKLMSAIVNSSVPAILLSFTNMIAFLEVDNGKKDFWEFSIVKKGITNRPYN